MCLGSCGKWGHKYNMKVLDRKGVRSSLIEAER